MTDYNFSKLSPIRRGLYLLMLLTLLSLVVVVILLSIACIRSLTLKDVAQYDEIKVDTSFELTREASQRFTEIFAKSLQYKTVSRSPGDYNTEELFNLRQYLIRSFPAVFNNSKINIEIVNDFSLLLSIQGSNKSISPYMLCAHLDVVPVDSSHWDNPPFVGKVITDPLTGEDYVWGRGAIDVKSVLVGILSSLDVLFSRGWSPERSFYVAFGHDEEVSGFDGAGHIAKILASRKVSLEFLLDEGISFTQGIIKQVENPVGLICVTEKGRMDIRLTVNGTGGHSSFPPKDQAVQKLVKALTKLYDNPHPSKFGSTLDKDMFMYLAPKVSFPYKIVLGNIWLFGPIVSYVLSLKSESDSLLRTTTAATIVQAGYKENVVPSTAWANINHRIHPSQTPLEVLTRDKAIIADDDVKLEVIESFSALPVSKYGPGTPFHLIAEVISNVFPQVVTAPGLLMGNTDTRHYVTVAKNMYRMIPFILDSQDVKTIHSHNERLSVKNFLGGIEFYKTLILRADDYNNPSQEFSNKEL